MPRIVGCTVDGIDEYCDGCLHEHSLPDCKVYRDRYKAVEIWGDD